MARPEVTVRVDGRVVCERCLVADRPWARMRGLLGRDDLPRGEGVLLRPAGSIHTFFMRFPIDVVFLDDDRCVMTIEREVGPWRTVSERRAAAVLELPGGECDRIAIREGVQLDFVAPTY
jgi:uncharacterized protein